MQFQIQTDIHNVKKSALQSFAPYRKNSLKGCLPVVAKIHDQFYRLDDCSHSVDQFLVLTSDLDDLIKYLITYHEWPKCLIPQDLFSISDLMIEFDLTWEFMNAKFGPSLQSLSDKWGFLLELPSSYQELLRNQTIEPALIQYMQNNGFKWRSCFAQILSNFRLSSSQQKDVIELLAKYLRRESLSSKVFMAQYSELLSSFGTDRNLLIEWLSTLSTPKLTAARTRREIQVKHLKKISKAQHIEWDHSLESSQLKISLILNSLDDWNRIKLNLQNDHIDLAIQELLMD